jgi:hypothetical protein
MRPLSSVIENRPVVAQVYLSPRQSTQAGEAIRWVDFKPNTPTYIPEQILGLVKTVGARHKDFVAAGIGERIITAAVTRPTYGTRHRQETSRPLKYLGLVPVQTDVPECYESGTEAVPFADLVEGSGARGESAVVVGYDLMSRASPLSDICRDIHDRPGNRCIQGVILPLSEAGELNAMLQDKPSSIRELSHLVLERVVGSLGFATPTPDYNQWPADINRVQFAGSMQADPTSGFVVSIS